jgi:regulator of sigma E protease
LHELMHILHTTLAFIVAIAVLVFVHEFGHFIVARRLGIRVEKFSIGFGPALFSWHSRDGEVEYVIAAIPLGGYVKMLGENPEEQEADAKTALTPEERQRAFDAQPAWKRASVSVAGPLFNFLFAILAFMVVGWVGRYVAPPVVGVITPASVAEQAGIVVGDDIVSVNGHDIHSWTQLEDRLKDAVNSDVRLELKHNGSMSQVSVHIPASSKEPLLINVSESLLGISPGMRVMVDSVLPGSPSAKAGLRSGDLIKQADGHVVQTVRDFVNTVRSHGGKSMVLNVERKGINLAVPIVPEKTADGIGRIGARMEAEPLRPPVLYRMGLLEGIRYGFVRTWDMTVLTFDVMGKMLTAAISPENLGGPIAIAQLAGQTAALGFASFCAFLALISVNLGVLNLMPIPILDGGHLAYLLVEKLRGRPLSPKMMARTQTVGLALIIMLMIFAFYNDLSHLYRG